MSISQRQKRVSSLIKEELSRLLIEFVQDSSSGLITVTGVEVSKDLKSAYVDLSIFGAEDKEKVLALLEKRKGFLRKSIASKIKLKYNPMLIFSLDATSDYEKRIDEILEDVKKHEKGRGWSHCQ